MSASITADASLPSLFAKVVVGYLNNGTAATVTTGEGPVIKRGTEEFKGAQGVVDFVSKHGGKHTEALLGATDAEKKEIQAHIKLANDELLPVLLSGDKKKQLGPIFKVKKAIQASTFLVSNHLTIADLIYYSYFHALISSWELADRISIVEICRWFDLIQHDPIVHKLAAVPQIDFVLDLPADKKSDAAPAKAASAKGGDKKAEGAPAKGGDKKADGAPAKGGDKKADAAPAKKAEGGAVKGGEKPAKGGAAKGGKAAAAPETPVDIARVNLRVGKIVSVENHPTAERLFVEKIDLGEAEPRTIVSGLREHYTLEQMQGRLVVVVANLKPAKLQGIMSAGMVLAASIEEPGKKKVELVTPPAGSKPGERVMVDGYAGEPDEELNPKKKIFETVKPDLKTNGEKVACYKDIPFKTSAGACTVDTLTNAHLG